MKRLIEIATGRVCGTYSDDYMPPADSVDADESLYRFEAVPDEEVQAKAKAERVRSIKAQLMAIDQKSIRPAREGDTQRLAELEAQAQALRAELE